MLELPNHVGNWPVIKSPHSSHPRRGSVQLFAVAIDGSDARYVSIWKFNVMFNDSYEVVK